MHALVRHYGRRRAGRPLMSPAPRRARPSRSHCPVPGYDPFPLGACQSKVADLARPGVHGFVIHAYAYGLCRSVPEAAPALSVAAGHSSTARDRRPYPTRSHPPRPSQPSHDGPGLTSSPA